jgi:phosphosulfolactate synthase
MHATTLTLPDRETKPRAAGITMVIDTGLPTHYFSDIVSSFSGLIDVIKLGWGTSLVTEDLKYKIDALHDAHVDYYFGGTLFEKFVSQGRFDDWRRLVDRFGCRHVEISNGTIDLTNSEKAEYIRRTATDYIVFSEVGYKESARSETMQPEHWIEYINEDLAAGANKVITEARESGKSGICGPNGQLKLDLIERIAESGIEINQLMFEAPNKDLQIALIRRFGTQVNLGNIAASDIIALETLRLGLRGDTLLDWDGPEGEQHA